MSGTQSKLFKDGNEELHAMTNEAGWVFGLAYKSSSGIYTRVSGVWIGVDPKFFQGMTPHSVLRSKADALLELFDTKPLDLQDIATYVSSLDHETSTLEEYQPARFEPRPVKDVDNMKFEFKAFSGFGSVGPLLIEFAPQQFDAAIASDSRFVEGTADFGELGWLRSYHQQLKSDPSLWDRYLTGWSEEDLELGDHIRLEKPDSVIIYLVELGRGFWAQIETVRGDASPTLLEIHSFDFVRSDDSLASDIANLIDSIHAGYAAAIELIVHPLNLSDEHDLYHDELGEDDDDEPFWGREIFELWERYCMSFDMRTVELVPALEWCSPQFAEMSRLLRNPTATERQRLVEAATEFNPGFGGQMGLFDEWAGPKSGRLDDASGVSLFATHDIDGELWAEVGCHSLISASGEFREKQHFVKQFGFLNYSQLHGKFGLKSPLASRPVVEAPRSTYELASEIAVLIQRLVDEFDKIPASDVEQRTNFSWNDGETTEMLYEMGELPTRHETPPYR